MRPETLATLKKNVPELQELVAFLRDELARLNTLDGLDTLPQNERDIAVSGRLWAHKTLGAMLAPLLMDVDKSSGVDPNDFVV